MNLTGRAPYQKGQPTPPKEPKRMRSTAKGKKSSSDCPIMRFAKGKPCLADWCDCGGSTETTAQRHVRKFGIGGMGMKTPNAIGFHGCQRAEDLFENTANPAWTWRGLCQALILTQNKLAKEGLI